MWVLEQRTGKRLGSSWICPLNPVTGLDNGRSRKCDLNRSAAIPRHVRYVILVVVLIGSALTGTLLWEGINPVSLVGRSLIMGVRNGAMLIITLFLFDLLVV